jgi:DNA-binding MarR family transcriptional regulator
MGVKAKSKYSPTPLHYMVFVLQQSAEELLLKEAGISLSYARILGVLDLQLPSSQKTISNTLHQTEANISRQLLLMVRQRLVKITKNKEDGRQRDVTLTALGSRKYDQAQEILKNQANKVLKSALGGEKRNFEQMINSINSSL